MTDRKLLRQSEIRGYATWYLDNVVKNNGKCKYGFMAELVQEASSVMDVPQITRDDIRNEVARIVEEQRKVSLEISGMPNVSSTINEPLDAPPGDVLQVSVGIESWGMKVIPWHVGRRLLLLYVI